MAHQPPISGSFTCTAEGEYDTQVTCDVLCSLAGGGGQRGSSAASRTSASDNSMHPLISPSAAAAATATSVAEKPKPLSCPKQHQLPMFLSKTYHMIDRCDPEIATWSVSGDNFVVKNVEQFASSVLPLYFKHSNFSSFARQLNFYGFRKMRTDPILTSDVDPRTACYVRFYHDKFQKDRPELLHHIKRATKSDMQSKDDVESLKAEISKLNECIGQMSTNMDRKLAEMSYEYNRRITSLTAEYDKLAVLVSQIIAHQKQQEQPPQVSQRPNILAPSSAPLASATVSAGVPPPPPPPPVVASSVTSTAAGSTAKPASTTDLMGQLSQVAAISLQSQQLQPPRPTATSSVGGSTTNADNPPQQTQPSAVAAAGVKRPAAEHALTGPSSPKQRTI